MTLVLVVFPRSKKLILWPSNSPNALHLSGFESFYYSIKKMSREEPKILRVKMMKDSEWYI